MIYIDRSKLSLPPQLLERSARARAEILTHWEQLGKQQRLKFDERVWLSYRPMLHQLFHGKCAFCESSLITSGGVFEHFRPKSSVDEDSRHPGYFWLTYDWNNLYLICMVCNNTKRNQFPISGKRAYTPSEDLAEENPLLLDPCNWLDSPESHLQFGVDGDGSGLVMARSERGAATINILALNREPLVLARKEQVEITTLKLKSLALDRPSDDKLDHQLKLLQDGSAPYAAVRREAVRQFLQTPPLSALTGRRKPAVQPSVQTSAETRPKGPRKRADVVRSQEQARPPIPPRQSSPRTGYVSRMMIQNFKSIASLDLTFDFARPGRAGWQVFLGENGTGKSSILQALAIALIGEENLNKLGLDAKSILHLPHKDGKSGFIRVWLGTDLEPIEVTFDANGIRYKNGHEGVNIFIRGFGPTRLLPRRRNAAEIGRKQLSWVEGLAADQDSASLNPSTDAKRIVNNLFDPYVPLCDVPAWLGKLDSSAFDTVALTIKDVLRFRNENNLILNRKSGAVKMVAPGGVPVSLDLLSYGQQSALVLAADIVSGIIADRTASGLEPVPKDFKDCAGIILLDEIDAHLHPRWKMEIVASLKRAFPFIQFLATTHEPLCLRGLEEREIVIVRRDNTEVTAEITPISPEGWRVDQLLTSELFGLFTTIDPDLDAEFQEYYFLLSHRESDLTPPQAKRLDDLRNTLQHHNRLGYTRRDQLLYEVIDDCLAKELSLRSQKDRIQLREETKRTIQQIWRRVLAAAAED